MLLSRATALPLLLTAFSIVACSSPPPELPGLDTAAFRADRHGCAGFRDEHRLVVKSIAGKLVGLKEGQISSLLGRPDATELGDRGQRVYLYQLTPGPACGAANRLQEPVLLRVRFNATERVSEALVMD